MIGQVVRQSWAESPARVIGAVVAAVVAVPVIWIAYVVAVVTLEGLGVPA